MSLGNAYSQGESLKQQGKYQRDQYEFNARGAELQAKDAIKRGEKDASTVMTRGKAVAGAQKVALAAQGIDIESGSAAELQADTKAAIAQDVQTVQNNAWREAWGYQFQALSLNSQGQMAEAAARNTARDTLLTGGAQAVGYGAQAYGYSGGKKRR